MKLRMLGLAAVMVAAATLRPAAQTPTLKSDLLKDWEGIRGTITKLADAMPEEKFGFKPTPEQRTFGEQLLHVAGANVFFLKTLGGKATAPAIDQKATSKAAIMKALGDSFDYGTAVINEQTDQSLVEAIKGPSFIGTATRARIAWDAIGHVWDEYGVVTTYLRLNNIVPPASRSGM